MLALMMFVVLFVVLLIGFPVAFTLGGVAVAFSFFTDDKLGCFRLFPNRIWGIIENPILMAVPLFVFMGVMLEKSGLAEDLLETMALLCGRLKGGLAYSVIIVGALLAASTGIVGATVVTMGLMSLPTMLKRGYKTELAAGTIAASGTLGQIIPPSIVLILLADQLSSATSMSNQQISVGDMFLAAMVPGLALVVLYLLYVLIVSHARPGWAPAMPAEELAAFSGKAMWKRIFSAFVPAFLLIVAVLGSIFAGVASPTEAAAVGALGATVLTAAHRRLTWKTAHGVMRETTHLTCMVFIILMGANAFSLIFRELEGDIYLQNMIEHTHLGPHGFLAAVMVIVFVAGFFIDFIEITFIFVPTVAPIFARMDVDLLWLGILFAMNLQTSFLTPPFGFSLFYLKGVAPKEVRTGQIYRGILPFIAIQVVALVLVICFPEIAVWLPDKVAAMVKAAKAAGP